MMSSIRPSRTPMSMYAHIGTTGGASVTTTGGCVVVGGVSSYDRFTENGYVTSRKVHVSPVSYIICE